MPQHTPAERAKNRRNRGNDIISGGIGNDILLGGEGDTLGSGTPDAFSRFLARQTGLDVTPATSQVGAVGQAEPGEEQFEYGPTAYAPVMGRQPIATGMPNLGVPNVVSQGTTDDFNLTGEDRQTIADVQATAEPVRQPAGLAPTAPVNPNEYLMGLPNVGDTVSVVERGNRQAAAPSNERQRESQRKSQPKDRQPRKSYWENAALTPDQLSQRDDDIFSPKFSQTPIAEAARKGVEVVGGATADVLSPVADVAKSAAESILPPNISTPITKQIDQALENIRNGERSNLDALLRMPDILPAILRRAEEKGGEVLTALKEWFQANTNPDIIGTRISDKYNEFQRGARQFRGRTEGRDEFSP
jgi:hypothetical protein